MSSLILRSECNRKVLPILKSSQLVYILTEILPERGTSDIRMPLNLTFVLDRSGSMAGPKLRNLKEAVKGIIDQLGTTDIVSIVTFETETKVLVPAQPVSDKGRLKKSLDNIKEGGSTNMAKGLTEGINQAQRYFSSERVSRLVLFTDGEATDQEDDSRTIVDKAGVIGIPLIGLGIGKNWNEDFILDLSDRSIQAHGSGSGKADYIQEPEDAVRIFQEVFDSMHVVARNVATTIRMVQGLEANRVWQVTPMISDMGNHVVQGRNIVIPVNELEQNGVSYLSEIMIPPRPEGTVRIAQADVTYEIPNRGQFRDAVDIIVDFSEDEQKYNQMDDRVMKVVERVQAFKLQTLALNEAEEGQVGLATQKLRQAVTILLSQGESELAEQMQQEVDQLERIGEISSEGKKTIKLTSRKTIRFSEE